MLTLLLSIGLLFGAISSVLREGRGIFDFTYLSFTIILFICNVVIGLKMYYQKKKNNEISNLKIKEKFKDNWLSLLLVFLSIFSMISSIVILVFIEVDKIQLLIYFTSFTSLIYLIIMITSVSLLFKRLYK